MLETPAETVTVFDKKVKSRLMICTTPCLKWMESDWRAADRHFKRVAVVDIGDDSGRIDLVNPEILEKAVSKPELKDA